MEKINSEQETVWRCPICKDYGIALDQDTVFFPKHMAKAKWDHCQQHNEQTTRNEWNNLQRLKTIQEKHAGMSHRATLMHAVTTATRNRRGHDFRPVQIPRVIDESKRGRFVQFAVGLKCVRCEGVWRAATLKYKDCGTPVDPYNRYTITIRTLRSEQIRARKAKLTGTLDREMVEKLYDNAINVFEEAIRQSDRRRRDAAQTNSDRAQSTSRRHGDA